ncbi:hypothetical protein MKL09_08795, partial [Methylobacterium sp. J-048]|uniref:hypothetical protein n=1 Tax=Methylobacterium sp. J-048 TaxID=2836635 RepID=UPI001FBB4152
MTGRLSAAGAERLAVAETIRVPGPQPVTVHLNYGDGACHRRSGRRAVRISGITLNKESDMTNVTKLPTAMDRAEALKA